MYTPEDGIMLFKCPRRTEKDGKKADSFFPVLSCRCLTVVKSVYFRHLPYRCLPKADSSFGAKDLQNLNDSASPCSQFLHNIPTPRFRIIVLPNTKDYVIICLVRIALLK